MDWVRQIKKQWQQTNWVARSMALLLFLLPWHTIWIYHQPIIKGSVWQWGTEAVYATEIFLWAIIICFVWRGRKHITKETFCAVPKNPLGIGLVILLIYGVLSATWSTVPSLATQHISRIIAALCVALFFIQPITRKERAWVWQAQIAASTIQAIIGISQFITQRVVGSVLLGMAPHVPADGGAAVVVGEHIGRVLRAYGSFPHANIFGGYMAVSIALLLLYVSRGMDTTGSRQKKLGMFFLLLLHGSALVLSFSRAAWIALAVGVITSMFYTTYQKKMTVQFIGAVLVGCLLTAIYVFPVMAVRLGVSAQQSSHEVRSVTERVSQLSLAKELFTEHRLFGTGVGNMTAAWIKKDAQLAGWQYQPIHAVPVLFLVEWGIVGLGILFYTLWNQRCLWRKKYVFTQIIFIIFPIMPLLLFDHYLYSSFQGLLILAVWVGFIVQNNTQKNA